MSEQKLEITGILLVGGESRRMGSNKALLEIGGQPLIKRNLEVLASVCAQVLISSREVELYSGYGYEVIPDIIKGKGPLVGLYSALYQAKYEYAFLAACDMPLINPQAISLTYERIDNFDAVVPYAHGKLHPLHAVYHKRTLPIIEADIKKDKIKVIDVLNDFRTKVLRIEEENFGPEEKVAIEQSLLNTNTPEEWQAIIEKVPKVL